MPILELTKSTLMAALAFVPRDQTSACLSRFASPGTHYALEHNRSLLAVGGINVVDGDLGEPWLLLTPYGLKRPLTTYKAIRLMLIEGMVAMGLRHMQAMVRADRPERIRLLEHLGFARESSHDYQGHTYHYYRGQRREGITDGQR